MQVASIQMSVVEGDKSATIQKAADAIERCGSADLVILPELWNIGFLSFDRYAVEAEDLEGPTLTMIRDMARRTGKWIHSGSFVEKEASQLFNTSCLVTPEGKIAGTYRKIHLFGFQSRETQLLTPGEKVTVLDTPFGPVGMATCFDLRFPEVFRRMVDLGTELFLVCSAWPYPRLEAWLMLNRVRALENQCYLISSNAVGLNQGIQFVGHSRVVGPWGSILAGAGDEEGIIKADLNMSGVQKARDTFPGLAGRKDWLRDSVPMHKPK